MTMKTSSNEAEPEGMAAWMFTFVVLSAWVSEGGVARFNKKTVKVMNQPGEYWNVPHGLLIKLKQTPESRQGKSSLHLIKG